MGLADGIFQMASTLQPQPQQPSADAGDVRRSLTGLVPVVLGNLMGTPAKPPEAEQMAAAAQPLPPAPAMIQPPTQQAPPMNGQDMANAIAQQPPNSMPTIAPQNPTLGDRFKTFGSQFAMNLGDYLIQRGGGADPRFAQNAASNRVAALNAQSEADYRASQTRIAEHNSRRVPVTLRDGSMAYIPQKDLAGYIKNLNTTQTSAANNAESNKTRLEVAGENNATKLDVATLGQGPQVSVPKDMQGTVQQFGVDPSKPISVKALNQILTASGKNERVIDIGAKRYKFNVATGEKEELGAAPGLVAGVARAEAFARAKATYSPVEFQDPDTGEIRTGSALEALNTGQAMVTRPNGEKILSRTAVMNDIEASLKQLKDKTHVLNGGNRGKIALALADPNSTPTKFLQSEVAASLSPDEQDYVIQNLNAREQIYGLRKALTGAAGGSDAQAAAILKTLPSASTPNSEYANRQIDTTLGVLGRLRSGIQTLGAGNKKQDDKQKTPPTSGTKRFIYKDGQLVPQ